MIQQQKGIALLDSYPLPTINDMFIKMTQYSRSDK